MNDVLIGVFFLIWCLAVVAIWSSYVRRPKCPDCEPYDRPHGPKCRSHPDYDGAPKE